MTRSMHRSFVWIIYAICIPLTLMVATWPLLFGYWLTTLKGTP